MGRVLGPALAILDMVTLRKRLAAGEFIRIEKQATRLLMLKMPRGETDLDDAKAQVSYYAVEAIERFDPTRGAAFSTFLYGHLRKRCLAQWKRSWGAKRRPHMGTCQFTDFAVDAGVPTLRLEIIELMEDLSAPNQKILKMILYHHSHETYRAFGARTYRHDVSKEIGISKREVESMVTELRKKIPEHLSTVEV